MTAKLLKKITEQIGSTFFQVAQANDDLIWLRSTDFRHSLYVNSPPGFGFQTEILLSNPDAWIQQIEIEDRDKLRQKTMEWLSQGFKGSALKLNYRLKSTLISVQEIMLPIFDDKSCVAFLSVIRHLPNQESIDYKNDPVYRELIEGKERAENANRAKSDFLAMMSHELRAPLNAILGMAQILRPSKLDAAQRDQLEVIETSGHTLLSLLNDVLDFAKLEMGMLSFRNENVDLLTLVQKTRLDLVPFAKEKNLDLRLEIEENLPRYVRGDPKRIRQILINLMSNAIKYTHSGHVTLQVVYDIRNEQRGDFTFIVKDTGIGIPRDKLSTVFNRFQQIDSVYNRKHEGVGLGLAIVKELVDHMCGEISVESELGVGSTFTCMLPLQIQLRPDYLSEPSIEYSSNAQIFQQFDARVLVVEDNAINQKVALALLEQLGCIVDIVDNGEAALRKFKEGYDLVFLDIGLPDMDGFTVGEKMRAMETEGEHIPIVALTAHVFAQDRKRCFDVGMDEVMAKPVMRDDLIAVLRRWTRVQV